MKIFFVFLFLLLNYIPVFSQNIIVKEIHVSGNTITKEHIIRREILLQEGDSLSLKALKEKIKYTRYNLQNTRLFNFVEITYDIRQSYAYINITLTERWYIWPIPLLEYAEPNLTTFIRNRDFSRIDYGGYLIHENFRGRREVLKAIIRQGFDKQYAIEYTLPYINTKKTWGLYFRTGYNLNHTITATTENNQRVFFTDYENYVRKQPYVTGRITYRHKYFAYHTIGAEWHNYFTTDSMAQAFPNFLGNSNTFRYYLSISHNFTYNKTDWIVYPLEGFFFSSFTQYVNLSTTQLLHISMALSGYQPLANRWFASVSFKAKKNTWNAPPYYLTKALGYKNNLRGFDKYIIDGTDFLLLQTDLKYNWLNTGEKKIPCIKNDKFSKYFLKAYLSAFVDAGYVYWESPGNNFLQNQWQYSVGLENTFVTYYNIVAHIGIAYLSTNEWGWTITVKRVF